MPGGGSMRAVDAEHYWLAARFERRAGWDPEIYPFNLPVVRSLDELAFHPKVTFLVGKEKKEVESVKMMKMVKPQKPKK